MRASILVALVVSGCASFTVVPDDDWRTVPPAERAAIDRAHADEVARTRDELATATAAVVEARRVLAAPVVHPGTSAPAAPGDRWADALAAFERRQADALAQVDTATLELRRRELAWREQRVELLTKQLAVQRCEREVVRAHAIDRHLLGSDTYDGAEYRGQLAGEQARWFASEARTDAAHVALAEAAAHLSTAKATYASVVRLGPTAPTSAPATASDLELTAWNARELRDPSHGFRVGSWRPDRAAMRAPHYLVVQSSTLRDPLARR